ncbi:MAG: hypothetical protein ACD_7C00086G0036 [uncultured bacterium]|nr:MAG: hypothetical protein ACD_7C00086G0036 [uncultured bacterium]HBR79754.1 hypothetical protein [Candidatus Moranbacteria bacterium]
MYKKICCLSIECVPDQDGRQTNWLLEDPNNSIREAIVTLAKETPVNDRRFNMTEIGHLLILVYRYPLVSALGPFVGSNYRALISKSDNGSSGAKTAINFILAEKSTRGHNSKDLHIPLFG